MLDRKRAQRIPSAAATSSPLRSNTRRLSTRAVFLSGHQRSGITAGFRLGQLQNRLGHAPQVAAGDGSSGPRALAGHRGGGRDVLGRRGSRCQGSAHAGQGPDHCRRRGEWERHWPNPSAMHPGLNQGLPTRIHRHWPQRQRARRLSCAPRTPPADGPAHRGKIAGAGLIAAESLLQLQQSPRIILAHARKHYILGLVASSKYPYESLPLAFCQTAGVLR